jgi:hypothetical protein
MTTIWLAVSRVACSSVGALVVRPSLSLLSVRQTRPGIRAQLLAKHERKFEAPLLRDFVHVCVSPYSIPMSIRRVVARGQHLPPHTEYQHPSLLPQLFDQADIAQE